MKNGNDEPHPLDRGLAAAFGGSRSSHPESRVAETLGVQTHVCLRDELDDVDPIVDPSSTEIGPAATSGRYSVLGEIARGGVGVIMKSRDTDLGRDVAMKVLQRRHVGNRAMVERFVEEAQIAGQLQHPGILPVYELGVDGDGRPWFTMKLVKGRTLAALLKERRDAADDRMRFAGIFEQVAQTVAYAHARGVVHRDLKPSNVMVGTFGEVQVVDWGLSKVLARGGVADESRRTRTDDTVVETVRSSTGSQSLSGSVMGTPAYMAPEQARGEIEHVDERADVFALGGILLEILTGSPPFTGDDPLEEARAARLGPALARIDATDIDDELRHLARWCLAADADDRPPSAKSVARAMTEWRQTTEERAHAADVETAEARARADQAARGRRLTIALSTMFVFAIILLFTVAFLNQKSVQDRRDAAATRVEAAITDTALVYGRAQNAPLLDEASWIELRTACDRLEELASDPDIDADRRGRLLVMVEELHAAERDHTLVMRMEETVLYGSTHLDEESWTKMREELEAAFLDFGVDLAQPPDAGSGPLMRASGLAVLLTEALELWLGTCFHLGSWNANPYTIEELMAWVDVMYEADDDPFRTELREAIFRFPFDTDTLVRLAREADLEAQTPRSLSWLGTSLVAMGEVEPGLDVMRMIADRYRDDPMVNYDTAYSFVAAGEWDEAIRYYLRTLSLRPGTAGLWRQLGVAYREVGDHRASIVAMEESIAYQEDYAPTWIDYAESLEAADRVDDAAAARARAAELDTEN